MQNPSQMSDKRPGLVTNCPENESNYHQCYDMLCNKISSEHNVKFLHHAIGLTKTLCLAAMAALDLTLPPLKMAFLAEEAANQPAWCLASTLSAAESGNLEELVIQLDFGMNPNVARPVKTSLQLETNSWS